MNNGYLTSASQLLGRLGRADRKIVGRILRGGMATPVGEDDLRAMGLLSHPACEVVQHLVDALPPALATPASAPDPTIDTARLRARISVVDGWQHIAECRGINPSIAVPVDDQVTPEMAKACESCPVRHECLAWGVERAEQPGVLGGYPRSDRLKIRAMLLRGRSQR